MPVQFHGGCEGQGPCALLSPERLEVDPLVSLDTQEIPVPPALVMDKKVLRHTPGMRKVEQCRAGHVEHGLVQRYLVVNYLHLKRWKLRPSTVHDNRDCLS